MVTIRSDRDQMQDGALESELHPDHPELERAEPVWPGFRAARLITLMKMRGDARVAAVLALLLIVATAAVLGAPHAEDLTREFGAALGIGLRASEFAN